MSFKNYITSWLRTRSMQLQVEAAAAGRPIPTEEEAQRLAAQEVAAQQRRSPTRFADAPEHITVNNAGAELWRRIEQVAERLREPFSPPSSPVPPVVKSSSGSFRVDPETPVDPVPPERRNAPSPLVTKQSEPPPPNQVIGIFSGKAATKLILDSEYHTSLHDPVTDNWRKSIERNNELALRRGKWIG